MMFDADGMLPLGDYELTFPELKESMLVQGDGSLPDWDAEWRLQLVRNLESLVGQLWEVGVTEVFADGSFAQSKAHPNDIDGYFVCDRLEFLSGRLAERLNLLDPAKCWTWDVASRWSDDVYGKPQLPMWHHYRVELFPHLGQSSGIRDEHGHSLKFPSAFRRSRDGRPRGIVKLKKEA